MRISFVELVFVAVIALAALQLKSGEHDARLIVPPPAPALVASLLPSTQSPESPPRTTGASTPRAER